MIDFLDSKKNISKYSGNAYWRELYENIENCKIILTVRDNEDIWYSSFSNFFRSVTKREGFAGGMVEIKFYIFGNFI